MKRKRENGFKETMSVWLSSVFEFARLVLSVSFFVRCFYFEQDFLYVAASKLFQLKEYATWRLDFGGLFFFNPILLIRGWRWSNDVVNGLNGSNPVSKLG